LLLGWGSTKGVSLDAIDRLNSRIRLGYLNLKLLWPFPEREFLEAIEGIPVNKIIAVEHSYGINIASLIAMSTGIIIEKRIAKFTGRPILLNELVEAIEKIIYRNEKRVVLEYGA